MPKVLYFASLRERMGRTEEDLALPLGVSTVGTLVAYLKSRDAAGAAAFAEPTLIRAALNQEFAGTSAPIRDGDEIAFFPPVTGG